MQGADPQRIGEYWLSGRLGAGGQGVVYDAYAQDGARVAVKVLHASDGSSRELAQMAAEARAAQQVASFCTAKILRVHLEPPQPYIVSEYIDGLSLQETVRGGDDREGRRFGGDDLHRLAIGIVTALSAIHQARVVHRDLKPGNVLLGPDGPRLIDFGIAQIVETLTGTPAGFAGTLPYIAPEVYGGQRAGAASDVFAWGAIMVFAATGEHAFKGGYPEIVHRVRTLEPDLSMLPERLRTLVGAALSKDPLARPSAHQILGRLTGAPSSGPGDLVAAGAEQAGAGAQWQPTDPALGEVAERAYAGLPAEDQGLVSAVFLRMVTPDETGRLSVRPVPASELYDRDEAAALSRIVAAFAPLLATADDRIVLTRPALLRAWPRLRGWLDGELAGLHVFHQIRQAAEVWDAHGHRRADILTGARLQEALTWTTTGRPHRLLNRRERGHLEAGTRNQTAQSRRSRAIALSLTIALVLTLGAAGWGFQSQQQAIRERDVAASRQLAALSQRPSSDPVVSVLQAVAAHRIKNTPESHAALLNILTKPERGTIVDRDSEATSVAFSPDGRTLAVGRDDKKVQLWDLRTQEKLGDPLTGCATEIAAMKFSPDGKFLATAEATDDDVDSAADIRLWDVQKRRQIAPPHKGGDSMAFTPDGGMLVSSSGQAVTRWDVRSRQSLGSLSESEIAAISSDGKAAATVKNSDDFVVEIWNPKTGRQITTIAPTDRSYTEFSLALSADGKTLATVTYTDVDSGSMAIQLWDVGKRKKIGPRITGGPHVAFSPNGQTFAVGNGREVRLWDVRTGVRLGEPLRGEFLSMAFGPDGRTFATIGAAGGSGVQLWDIKTHRLTSPSPPEIPDLNPDTAEMTLSPDGQALAFQEENGSIGLRDIKNPQKINNLHVAETPMAFSADGQTLATNPHGGDLVRLWNVRKRQKIDLPLRGPSGKKVTGGITVQEAMFSSNGSSLVVTSTSGQVWSWNLKSDPRSQRPVTFAAHRARIAAVAVSPDGRIIATSSDYGDGDTAGRSGMLQLWNSQNGRPIGSPMRSAVRGSESLKFSPNGETLAIGEGAKLRLLKTDTRQQIGLPLIGAISVVSATAFSPDGNILAIGHLDGTFRVWNVGTRQQLGATFTSTRRIVQIRFSQDGQTITTNGYPPTDLRQWNIGLPVDPVGAACSIAKRSLNRAEWDLYVPPGPEFRTICSSDIS